MSLFLQLSEVPVTSLVRCVCPSLYVSLAGHTAVLANCMFWDSKETSKLAAGRFTFVSVKFRFNSISLSELFGVKQESKVPTDIGGGQVCNNIILL